MIKKAKKIINAIKQSKFMKIMHRLKSTFDYHFEHSKKFRALSTITGLLLLVLTIIVASLLAVYFGNIGKVTAAISVVPDNLDPTFCDNAETETILANCFEGLMKIDETGNPVKAAASDYTISENGLVYTFTIDENSRWSDGTSVKASDFVYAWRRTANPYNSSAYAYYFETIAGYDKIMEDFEKEQQGLTNEDGSYINIQMSDLSVKAAGEKILVVRLKEKDPAFLNKCASAAFFPLHEDKVKPFSRIWSTDKDRFSCNGAFVLETWMDGNFAQFVPNPFYRDKENVKLKQLKFLFIEDGTEAKKMFDRSSILFSTVLPEDNPERAAKDKDYISYESMGTYFLYFNVNQTPFDDVRVRQALTLAIDRESLIKETASVRGTPASGLITDGFGNFRQAGETFFDATETAANIEKAKALLKDAGYENGKGFPTFEYLFNDNTYSRETAEILKKMWEENLGIKCTLKSVSWQKLDEMREDGNFTVAKGGLIAPYNDTLFMLDKFTTGNNFCSWKNAEYDKVVSQMINSQGENKTNLAHKAEKILLDNWVICPLYHYKEGYFASDRIENYYVTSTGIAYFVNAKVGAF